MAGRHGPAGAKPPGVAPDLRELVSLLDQSDSRAMAWWQAHEAALAVQLPPVLLRRLANAMARYDFDAALQALSAGPAGRLAGAGKTTLTPAVGSP